MAKPEWGTKRLCLSCGARFYDMLRDPIICPSCQTEFDPTASTRTRRTRSPSKALVSEKLADKAPRDDDDLEDLEEIEVAEDEDEEDLDAADEEDEDERANAIEDVSELGDDDVSDVIDADVDEVDNET